MHKIERTKFSKNKTKSTKSYLVLTANEIMDGEPLGNAKADEFVLIEMGGNENTLVPP